MIAITFIKLKVQQRATQDQIAYFGQTPSQLLTVPHMKRMSLTDVLHMQVPYSVQLIDRFLALVFSLNTYMSFEKLKVVIRYLQQIVWGVGDFTNGLLWQIDYLGVFGFEFYFLNLWW